MLQGGHALAEQPATAADVDGVFAFESGMAVDPRQSGRVDVVQGAKFRVRIPPAMGDFPKLVQFARIGVAGCIHSVVHVIPGYRPVLDAGYMFARIPFPRDGMGA